MRDGFLNDLDCGFSENVPLVTIIVPVYNTAEGPLRRCLRSLLAQDYWNIEFIVVDDGSDKDCLAVLNDELSGDPRVRIISGGHEGVSHARNIGIDSSCGEWIAFSDADDEVEPHFVSEALGVALKEGCDLVCGGVDYLFRDEAPDESQLSRRYIVLDDENDLLNAKMQMLGPVRYRSYAGLDFEGRGPVAKLYRRALLGSLRFDMTISIGEDTLFNYRFIELSSRFAVVDVHWYFYYQYEGSSVHSTGLLPWKKSMKGILASREENEDPAPFVSRCTFMSAQAIESLVRSEGLLFVRTRGTKILEYAADLGCFSGDCFKGYDPSRWLSIFVRLCKTGHFNLAALFWGARTCFKDFVMKKKLVDPSAVSSNQEESRDG